MTDPIADMLTRVRNAISANHPRVDVPGSKLKLEVARILKEEGYINNFTTKGEGVKYVIRIFCVTTRREFRRSASLGFRAPADVFMCRDRDTESSRRLRDQYPFPPVKDDEWKRAREKVGGEYGRGLLVRSSWFVVGG